MQKLMPGKGLKKLKKSSQPHRLSDVLTGQETLLELLNQPNPPTNQPTSQPTNHDHLSMIIDQ